MLNHEWKKSSRSQAQGDCVEVRLGPEWKKSSRSQAQGQCVEVRATHDVIQVRDTKLGADSPILEASPQDWQAFLTHEGR